MIGPVNKRLVSQSGQTANMSDRRPALLAYTHASRQQPQGPEKQSDGKRQNNQ